MKIGSGQIDKSINLPNADRDIAKAQPEKTDSAEGSIETSDTVTLSEESLRLSRTTNSGGHSGAPTDGNEPPSRTETDGNEPP